MKMERPRLGGCVFVRRTSSVVVVVVTDFFRVPCFKTGVAGRKRPASRNHEIHTCIIVRVKDGNDAYVSMLKMNSLIVLE